jgi:cytosine/adenosine deaminase-related metal-dependent hydrolase
VQGPRLQVVGQSLNSGNANYVKDMGASRFYTGRTENKDVNGPWLARTAVREAKQHGVDYVKMASRRDQFSWYVKWGMTTAEALRMTYIAAPRVFNYGWDQQIGKIEKGRYADIIAVPGNPLADVNEMERVEFVMKGGVVMRNDTVSSGAVP